MTNMNLKAEFKKRGPWITKFVIEGQPYGGNFDALNDTRLGQFFQAFPEADTVLELGSLEGGHSFGLAQNSAITRILSIEGRPANIERAKFVQALLGASKVEFLNANLETTDLTQLGRFDAVFCVGLLYHLPEPWKLIERIALVTRHMFIWTHYADPRKANKTVQGYQGLTFRESGLADPLSGLSAASFWLTLDSLTAMLKHHGFEHIHLIEDNPKHPHGPSITLSASA